MHSLVLASAAIAAAGQAFAVDIGECAAPSVMSAKLKAEDQHSVAAAQQITENKRALGMIFTMSTDRKTGYILQADKPLGEPATRLCVYNRMVNVRLFDARKRGVPVAALLKAPETEALRRCGELTARNGWSRSACASLNATLRRVEPFGQRVVLQAFLVQKSAGGAYVPDGTLVTVAANVTGSIDDYAEDPARGILGGMQYSSLPDGASFLNATLVYVEYTPYGLAALAP